MYLQLGLMGMEFEKLKKKIPTDRPIPEKQGQVRGNSNIDSCNCSNIDSCNCSNIDSCNYNNTDCIYIFDNCNCSNIDNCSCQKNLQFTNVAIYSGAVLSCDNSYVLSYTLIYARKS